MKVEYLAGRETEQELQTKVVWLVRAQVLGSSSRIGLMTDHPVKTEEGAGTTAKVRAARLSSEDEWDTVTRDPRQLPLAA